MSTSSDSESETDLEDYPSPASNATESSQATESSDRTQQMNFDSDIEWLEATYMPSTGNIPLDSSTPTVNHSSSPSRENTHPDSEASQQPHKPAGTSTGRTTQIQEDREDIAANLPYLITSETIKALRYYAEWSYPQLQAVFGIPLGSLHRMIHQPIPSQNPSTMMNSERPRGRGWQPVVNSDLRMPLLTQATESAHNRRLPYTEVAELEGIQLGHKALRKVFEDAGYHRRVARVKPFLTERNKERRLAWGDQFRDWNREDWMDVIWLDECAFSVEEVCGTVWVTRRPGEEYDENCLVPRFPRCTTIMVWGAIYRNQKSRLVIWDTPSWGRINGSTYVDYIIRPNLHPWWQFLHSTGQTNSGYIYFQQDNAPAHRSRLTQAAMQELGLANYLLPWPATSPDMSPIEGIWCLLKRRIMQLRPRPTTTPELLQAIHQQWADISPQEIENLTSSMPNRIAALREAHGGHTRF